MLKLQKMSLFGAVFYGELYRKQNTGSPFTKINSKLIKSLQYISYKVSRRKPKRNIYGLEFVDDFF